MTLCQHHNVFWNQKPVKVLLIKEISEKGISEKCTCMSGSDRNSSGSWSSGPGSREWNGTAAQPSTKAPLAVLLGRHGKAEVPRPCTHSAYIITLFFSFYFVISKDVCFLLPVTHLCPMVGQLPLQLDCGKINLGERQQEIQRERERENARGSEGS